MDAPTTTSADSGTSGGRPGGGWFTPRRAPAGDNRPEPDTAGEPAEDGRDRIPTPIRPLASIRAVGSVAGRPAPPQRETPEVPAGHGGREEPETRQPAPVDDVPDAFRPRTRTAGGGDRPAPHPESHEGPGAAFRGGGAPFPPTAPAPARPGPVQPDVVPPDFVPPQSPGSAPPAAEEPPAVASTALPPEAAAPEAPPAEAPAFEQPAGPQPQPQPQPEPTAPSAAASDDDRDASPDAVLVRRTMREIGPVADQVTAYFYALLFVRHPDLRALFPAAMDAQRDRLLKALLTAAEHMDTPDVLTDYLRNLGRGHRKYGTEAAHYPAVGEALLGALSRYASATWDVETEAAWVRTYTTISQIMIDAAAENEPYAPPWWEAEVVSHELRTPDIAVITVRPDQPYPFRAGQYTSLETPWWPRVWRHYSFASAPRTDGLLAFHVKAVPAGWVSNALVHHAGPGDVLRLGPPAGSMTVDHSTDSGLLCLGGGTGIAPIKALVEDVAEHGNRRPVEVFYGARHDYDLYDIDTMLRLQSVHPWLAVRAVIAEGSGQSHGPKGLLPEAVVRDYGPWHEYDAYLSGPPGMVRSGITALRGAGIPVDRIRHDSLDELVAAST
ncbi:flavohemoprotein [Streptomyces sp. 150FB]|uniref:globin domain-containing protein n=1 Tax=Streptomyces sp. 150FB TaxID=1576605 RepID=UPI00058949D9|nr:globin domain-containing protein [Streptomyces sp. 150FB]KIF78990.1 flavohemoprotein [Streptomyces sp. 150FB]